MSPLPAVRRELTPAEAEGRHRIRGRDRRGAPYTVVQSASTMLRRVGLGADIDDADAARILDLVAKLDREAARLIRDDVDWHPERKRGRLP